MKTIYQESLRQRRLIPWLLVAVIWGIVIWKVISEGLSNEHLLLEVVFLFLLPLFVTLLLFFLKLTIIVSDTEILYQYFPVHKKFRSIYFSLIQNAELQTYNKDRSFHGWGLGISFRKKVKSYTVSGYEGIEIRLTDGTQIFLGASHPEKIKEIIDYYNSNTGLRL